MYSSTHAEPLDGRENCCKDTPHCSCYIFIELEDLFSGDMHAEQSLKRRGGTRRTRGSAIVVAALFTWRLSVQ